MVCPPFSSSSQLPGETQSRFQTGSSLDLQPISHVDRNFLPSMALEVLTAYAPPYKQLWTAGKPHQAQEKFLNIIFSQSSGRAVFHCPATNYFLLLCILCRHTCISKIFTMVVTSVVATPLPIANITQLTVLLWLLLTMSEFKVVTTHYAHTIYTHTQHIQSHRWGCCTSLVKLLLSTLLLLLLLY